MEGENPQIPDLAPGHKAVANLPTAKSLHLPLDISRLDDFVCAVKIRVFERFRICLVQPHLLQWSLQPILTARISWRKYVKYDVRIAERLEHLTKDREKFIRRCL
jgi:hypothetical protein